MRVNLPALIFLASASWFVASNGGLQGRERDSESQPQPNGAQRVSVRGQAGSVPKPHTFACSHVRERRHLVQQTAERPNVRALVVRHLVHHLGTHVVRRADVRLRKARLAAQLLCESKVPELGVVLSNAPVSVKSVHHHASMSQTSTRTFESRKMFPGLMSRCRIGRMTLPSRWRWHSLSAKKMCVKMCQMKPSSMYDLKHQPKSSVGHFLPIQ